MENNIQKQTLIRNQLKLNLGEELNALISASHALNVRRTGFIHHFLV